MLKFSGQNSIKNYGVFRLNHNFTSFFSATIYTLLKLNMNK